MQHSTVGSRRNDEYDSAFQICARCTARSRRSTICPCRFRTGPFSVCSAPTAPGKRRCSSACSALRAGGWRRFCTTAQPLAPQTFERIAYVPERSVLYEWMTVAEHVEMNRRAYAKFDPARAVELLGQFNVDPRKRGARALKRHAHGSDGRAGVCA